MRKIRAFTHEPVPIKYGTVQPRTTHYVSGSGFLSRTRSGTGGSAPRNPARKDATAVPAKLLNGRRDPACVQIDLREKPWSFTPTLAYQAYTAKAAWRPAQKIIIPGVVLLIPSYVSQSPRFFRSALPKY